MNDASAERRRGDRRGAPRDRPLPRDESWFATLGVALDAHHEPDPPLGAPPAAGEAARTAGTRPAADPTARRGTHWAPALHAARATTFQRLYLAFVAARAVLGLSLLAAQLIAAWFAVRPPFVVTAICTAYAAQAVLLWIWPRIRPTPALRLPQRLQRRHWLAVIGVDVLCFSMLHLLAPTAGLNFVALFVLPVLTSGVLTRRPTALATVAGITLVLLGVAWVGVVQGADAPIVLAQAGLVGIGFFVITLLAGELAARLAREEQTARGTLEIARQQAQLNRLVIEGMSDGVLVVDRRGRVRAANPSARTLLAPSGMAPEAPFPLRAVPAWDELLRAVERAFFESSWPDAGRDVTLPFSPGVERTLRLRVRFSWRREAQADEALCVVFMEDLRSVQARTRQEKLAAMGRVSAGIAHEFRNPLAAIAQANALLLEDDEANDAQRRLMRIVDDNVERLKRIVDDVMEAAPAGTGEAGVIDAAAVVGAVCAEWARTGQVRLGEGSLLQLLLPAEPVGVVFDAEHLRRVLVNLLDNARRHGGDAPGAVIVELVRQGPRHVLLGVANQGDPIPPEVERFLFEPFFSTRSRGTGLGLYICRELCERYGASIDYRQRPAPDTHRNEFQVTMRSQSLPDAPGMPTRSLFDT